MHKSLPKVSCFCATYGRVHCLEEAIECFLKQDYEGEKELVILNDFAGQHLRFDHPEVKVYNIEKQIAPLGAKFNATVELCTGEVLFVWEDDDIYLPHRISYTIDRMQKGMFHVRKAYIWDSNKGKYVVTGNYFHCNLAITKALFDEVGGYVISKDKCDLDVDMLTAARVKVGYSEPDFPDNDIFYIYRWGETNSYHASGWGTSDIVRASEFAATAVANKQLVGEAPAGDVYLKPHWKKDYIALTKQLQCT